MPAFHDPKPLPPHVQGHTVTLPAQTPTLFHEPKSSLEAELSCFAENSACGVREGSQIRTDLRQAGDPSFHGSGLAWQPTNKSNAFVFHEASRLNK